MQDVKYTRVANLSLNLKAQEKQAAAVRVGRLQLSFQSIVF